MKKQPNDKQTARVDVGRRRLMAGAIGVGAAAGLGLVSINAQAAPAADKQPAAKASGYRETEHIRRYYRAAKEI